MEASDPGPIQGSTGLHQNGSTVTNVPRDVEAARDKLWGSAPLSNVSAEEISQVGQQPPTTHEFVRDSLTTYSTPAILNT